MADASAQDLIWSKIIIIVRRRKIKEEIEKNEK